MSMRYQTYEFSARMGIGVPKNAAPIRQANGDAALINMVREIWGGGLKIANMWIN